MKGLRLERGCAFRAADGLSHRGDPHIDCRGRAVHRVRPDDGDRGCRRHRSGPAATVAEAIDFLHTERPDAAIADVHLPDGTIAAFLDALPPGIPVVVHTGVGLPADVTARHPDVPVYSKPTEPGILLARLGEKLGGR